MRKIKIGVLFGGLSENEGSIEHGLDVINCLKKNLKYEIVPIYITKKGAWILYNDNLPLPINSSTSTINIILNAQKKGCILLPPNNGKFISLDLVFSLVMGPFGEDGCIPGLLELADIAYVGSGVLASSLGMDKIAFKMILKNQNLPHSPFCYTTRYEWENHSQEVFAKCEKNLTLPWFIKPANRGSSIGISKVKHAHEFNTAMEEALQFDNRILIEQSVNEAREIEMGVMGNQLPEVTLPGELIHKREFFDYQAKYFDKETKLIISPHLPVGMVKELQKLALQVYGLISCSGFARIDFLVRTTDQKIFISEINTVPGLSRHRMLPKLLMAQGYTYEEILDRLIQLGFERHAEKHKNKA